MKTSFHKFMASNAVAESTNVELASMKVDLALADDVNKIIDDTFKFGSKLDMSYLEFDILRKKIIQTHTDLNNAIVNATQQYNTLQKKSLELGVEPPEKVTLLYKEMLKMAKEELARQKVTMNIKPMI